MKFRIFTSSKLRCCEITAVHSPPLSVVISQKCNPLSPLISHSLSVNYYWNKHICQLQFKLHFFYMNLQQTSHSDSGPGCLSAGRWWDSVQRRCVCRLVLPCLADVANQPPPAVFHVLVGTWHEAVISSHTCTHTRRPGVRRSECCGFVFSCFLHVLSSMSSSLTQCDFSVPYWLLLDLQLYHLSGILSFSVSGSPSPLCLRRLLIRLHLCLHSRRNMRSKVS